MCSFILFPGGNFFFGLGEAVIFGSCSRYNNLCMFTLNGCSVCISNIRTCGCTANISFSFYKNIINITSTNNNSRFRDNGIRRGMFGSKNFRNRNFSSRNSRPRSIFHVTVIVVITPSGVLLDIRHVIICHSLKNVFNNKLVMLPCLNDINKKRNFRVTNHFNKDLVHKQGVFKITSRSK